MKEVAIEGDVAVVTFENNETGFRVVKVNVPERHERLTIVGMFPRVSAGARIRARGTMESDRIHGEQLRATSVTELAPTTLAGIEKYLGSGMIKGIGRSYAQRIVHQFKLETLKVLDEQPHRLREVYGLGPARADQLAAAWQEQRAIRDVMVFLQAHGASVHLAARIFKRYGPKAVAIVSSDPYPPRDRRVGRRLPYRRQDRCRDGDRERLAAAHASGALAGAPRRDRAGALLC